MPRPSRHFPAAVGGRGTLLATSLTAAVLGVDAHLVRVETDTAAGFPKFTMVGLPDSAVKESEGRIRAALRNCGYAFKWDRRITVNLAPASLRKVGSSYDLATAVGLLPMMLMARRQGLKAALVPMANLGEGAVVEGIDVHPVASLPEAVALALAERRPPPPPPASV